MNCFRSWAKRLFALMLCFAFSLAMTGAKQDGQEIWNYKSTKRGVVRIWASDVAIDTSPGHWFLGSGFGVGKVGEATDVFVTNRHVVTDDNGNIMKYVYLLLDDNSFVQVIDGKGYRIELDKKSIVKCKVLYPTSSTQAYPDLAVLRAERLVTERIALPLRSGFEMESGDHVFAMGFPGSADDITTEDTLTRYREPIPSGVDSITVTDGIISRIVDYASERYTTSFQHTAQINHGNSGGPLVSEDGLVIGLNTWGRNYGNLPDAPEWFLSLFVDYAMQKLDELGIKYETSLDRYLSTVAPAPSTPTPAPSTPTPAPSTPTPAPASPTPSPESTGKKLLSETNPTGPVILCAAAGILVLAAAAVWFGQEKKKGAASGPVYRLQGIQGAFAGRRFAIEKDIRIGRDPGRSDLTFPPDRTKVSGMHCVILHKGSDLYIQDCGSRNGTFVNGRPIAPSMSVQLQLGDTIHIAGQEECFRIGVSHQRKGK